MSRSHNKARCCRNSLPASFRFLEKKRARRALHLALVDELRECATDDELLEVLADLHEEQGRLALAERLRRGRDSSI